MANPQRQSTFMNATQGHEAAFSLGKSLNMKYVQTHAGTTRHPLPRCP